MQGTKTSSTIQIYFYALTYIRHAWLEINKNADHHRFIATRVRDCTVTFVQSRFQYINTSRRLVSQIKVKGRYVKGDKQQWHKWPRRYLEQLYVGDTKSTARSIITPYMNNITESYLILFKNV